jgi:cytoskeletal protein CcmA (bactofilin family)
MEPRPRQPGAPGMKKLWKKSMVVETLIGEQTEIQGDLRFAGGLHLDGCVKGRVISTDKGATLSIGATGLVEGDVHAPRLVLHGRVNGHVYAEEHVSLGAKARVVGNLYYRTLEMAAGAKVMGQLVLQEEPPTLK